MREWVEVRGSWALPARIGNKYAATLDTAGLPPGLYLLRLTGGQTATLKVLVE